MGRFQYIPKKIPHTEDYFIYVLDTETGCIVKNMIDSPERPWQIANPPILEPEEDEKVK